VRDSDLDTNGDTTDLENGLRILFEVFERLDELFSSEFANPLVVSLSFERPLGIVCVGFIGRVDEIGLKRETCKVDILPKRNRVYKEELQSVGLSKVHIMNKSVSQHPFPNTVKQGGAMSMRNDM